MAISLSLPERQKLCKRTYSLSEDLVEDFEHYVQAAQEQYPNATDSIVLMEILKTHMGKDRAFQAWRKAQAVDDHTRKEGDDEYQTNDTLE